MRRKRFLLVLDEFLRFPRHLISIPSASEAFLSQEMSKERDSSFDDLSDWFDGGMSVQMTLLFLMFFDRDDFSLCRAMRAKSRFHPL